MRGRYIYEPWKAPVAVQKASGCVVGVDYPKPVVDHESISKVNMEKMAKAYAAHNEASGSGSKGGKGQSSPSRPSGGRGGRGSGETGAKRPLKQTTLPKAKK